MWLSVVCTLVYNDTRHYVVKMLCNKLSYITKRVLCDVAQFVARHFDHVMTGIVVDKSTDHAKPHLFFYHNICLDN